MHNLFNFLVRFSTWFVFLFYVVISCMLLFNNNPYQHHIYLTSAGKIASGVYSTTDNITSYFHLRDINEDLQIRNANLELEVISLRNRLRSYQDSQYADSLSVAPGLDKFSFIIAHVINNSISRPHNYITIEKGSIDGIEPEMGVVDQNGVVGIVNVVGEHTARIISLLNPNLRLSCKIKGGDNFGSLIWDGKSPEEAILEELPRHAEYIIGDTIITSGYSAVFPEGIPVGVVTEKIKDSNDNFFSLRIKLMTDFSRLSTVRVITNSLKDEIIEVEKDMLNAKTK
ncbi:MAG: rod shape-determining protein MreC [Muribaculaceae bacterium]|nr:rod shape-determining protein MreC [Muribaculaceae bacterium]